MSKRRKKSKHYQIEKKKLKKAGIRNQKSAKG